MASTATEHPAGITADRGAHARRLVVVRQDRDTRRFLPVAILAVEQDGTFVFQYLEDAVLDPDFQPVPGFPEPAETYRSTELFPFFRHRVMSPRRPDYPAHLRAMGLEGEDPDPVEILVRTAGRRATDTYQVVPEPTVHTDGTETRLFLASGIRHLDGATERVAALDHGQSLMLRPDPDNRFDPQAILLDVASGEPVGYIPMHMCGYVHQHLAGGARIDVMVEQANGPEVPRHLQLLCRMRVVPVG
jgi:hypothetical protein